MLEAEEGDDQQQQQEQQQQEQELLPAQSQEDEPVEKAQEESAAAAAAGDEPQQGNPEAMQEDADTLDALDAFSALAGPSPSWLSFLCVCLSDVCAHALAGCSPQPCSALAAQVSACSRRFSEHVAVVQVVCRAEWSLELMHLWK